MKRIAYFITLLALTASSVSCDPSHDDESGATVVSSEKLTEAFQIIPKSQGNNNLTITTTPSYYIWVYDANTNQSLGSGTTVDVQVIPPATQGSYYIETRDMVGNVSKSGVKSVSVSEYTDLPKIYDRIFKIHGEGDYTTTYWTWNTEASDGVWGNGGYMGNTGPGWWVVRAEDINSQCQMNNLPKDGLDGWFGLNLQGVTTSRGETGTVSVNENKVLPGWDIGTMTFSGTIPLLGIAPNDGKKRQYVYQILDTNSDELRLCAPDPGAGSWGTAWFWNFKRIER